MDCVIGIDIGGTNTKMMAMAPDGTVLACDMIPTAAGIPRQTLGDIAAAAISLAAKCGCAGILAVGVGVPGPVNSHTGIAYRIPNFGWRQVDVRGILQDALHCPVVVDNDGNINLLGEWQFGAGQGLTDLVLVTLGTGIGGGILANGSVVRGGQSTAGEIGHIPVDHSQILCSCGKTGHLESYCSSKALLDYTRALLPQYPDSVLQNLEENSGRPLSAETVFRGFGEQDRCCMEVVDRYLEYLSMGLCSLIHILNPQRIILGGGISHAFPLWGDSLERKVGGKLMDDAMRCSIICSALFEDAGAMGACALALQEIAAGGHTGTAAI